MDYDQLLDLGAELGRSLMESGAEIYRVEESVRRLLTAYGTDPQVFAIPSCLIVSVKDPEGRALTRMCRIQSHGTDIELLERCNDLCRRLCRTPLPVDRARQALDEATRDVPQYSTKVLLLGFAMTTAFFTLFFGGGWLDWLAAGLCGLAVGLCMLCGQRFTGTNLFFRTVISAAVLSGVALVLMRLGIGRNLESITIGTLMVLVPGMALTNAMREIMASDLISGLTRTAEAILVATAIALGTAVSLLGGGAAGQSGGSTQSYFLPSLWAALACIGFALQFNVRGWRGLLLCGVGAGLSWLAYLAALLWGWNDVAAAFFAALCVGVFSEIMARVRRCPVTGYLQVALLPLVPGAGIYHTMRYCVQGSSQLFLYTLLHTLGFAAALSVGAMLATSVLRGLLPKLHRG